MSAKAMEENAKKLVALGFSKTKALKALKDTGGNVAKAKEMLERQIQQAEKEQQHQELIRKRQEEEEERKKAQAELRKMTGDEDPLAVAAAQVLSEGRRHPCIVQYKNCRYGKFCLLRDLPGDTCINHFNGACIYGSTCRNRHTVDGVDIRHYIPNPSFQPVEQDGVLGFQSDGQVIVCTAQQGGGIQLAERYFPDGTAPMVENRLQPMPMPYQWNAAKGSEASYSDPLTQQDRWNAEGLLGADGYGGDSATADLPTPFLDKARAQPSQQLQQRSAAPQIVFAPTDSIPQSNVMLRCGDPGYVRHPCIYQCGGCRFGDQCNHANRPADVCVFFLNGRCNYDAKGCRYRHEDSMQMSALAAAAAMSSVGTAPKESSPLMGHSSVNSFAGRVPPLSPLLASPQQPQQSPPVGFVLKPNAVVGGMSLWSLNESLASREQAQLEKQYAPPPRSAHYSVLDGQGMPSSSTLGSIGGCAGGAYTPTPSHQYSSTATAGPSPPIAALSPEDERRAFLAMREVFPQVDAPLLLHCLRLANGDRNRVAEALANTHCTASTQLIESALSAAYGEEPTEAHRPCSSDSLLALCSIFPHLDVPIIEDALQRAAGDYSEAFSMLVCSSEHLTQVDFSNKWTALGTNTNASDLLKLQRLKAMFKDLDDEIIECAFESSMKQTQIAIEALTNVCDDVKELTAERIASGNDAMKFDMKPALASLRQDAPQLPAVSSMGGFSVVGSSSPSSSSSSQMISQTDLYQEVAQEAVENGDWRRVREKAYMINKFRIRLLSMAAMAYGKGDGKAAKSLSVKAAGMAQEYRRLNMIAMRALEEERNNDMSVSVLDLHGFHVDEALDVLVRRLQLCSAKGVPRLKIVIGRGQHSQRGRSTVFPAVMNELSSNPMFLQLCQVVSVKPAVIEVRTRRMLAGYQ